MTKASTMVPKASVTSFDAYLAAIVSGASVTLSPSQAPKDAAVTIAPKRR